jgi:hypothetical protein
MATTARAGIRGPELYEAGAIAIHIATQHPEALHRYAQGLSTVIKAWQLLAADRRLKTLYMERAFLIHQLKILEARDPQAVAAALARQRSVPARATDALDEPDPLHEALRSIKDGLD